MTDTQLDTFCRRAAELAQRDDAFKSWLDQRLFERQTDEPPNGREYADLQRLRDALRDLR